MLKIGWISILALFACDVESGQVELSASPLETCDIAALRAFESCEVQRLDCGIDLNHRGACLEFLRQCRLGVQSQQSHCYWPIDPEAGRVLLCDATCETDFRRAELETATGRVLDSDFALRARDARAGCEISCSDHGGEP